MRIAPTIPIRLRPVSGSNAPLTCGQHLLKQTNTWRPELSLNAPKSYISEHRVHGILTLMIEVLQV